MLLNRADSHLSGARFVGQVLCKLMFLKQRFFTIHSIVVIFVCGRKRVMAVMKHRIFDVALKAKGIGEEGYEKPNKAQIENTKNIAARVNRVYFDILVKGDKVNSEKLEISTRNKGRKKSKVSCVGMGGYSLHITIRSYGSSNIIGADIVATMALPNAILNP
jgi:hypothetical protein